MPTDERTDREDEVRIEPGWPKPLHEEVAFIADDESAFLNPHERAVLRRAAVLLTERTGERERLEPAPARSREDVELDQMDEDPAPEPERGEGAPGSFQTGSSEWLQRQCERFATKIAKGHTVDFDRYLFEVRDEMAARLIRAAFPEPVEGREPDAPALAQIPGGFRVVADPTVPRDEVHWRDAEGRLLGKITGVGATPPAPAGEPETDPHLYRCHSCSDIYAKAFEAVDCCGTGAIVVHPPGGDDAV